MLNVSSLIGSARSDSDALRYGWDRPGETTPGASTTRRPVVVWNSTRGCNLSCSHCYASATRRSGDDELSTEQGLALIADLASYEVPALLLSGGEPLTRPDLVELAREAHRLGIRVTLSSNGTLISPAVAVSLRESGVSYVGISIDGDEETHDRLRCREGARAEAVAGLRRLGEAGVRRGVRFTLTPGTYRQLEAVLELVESEDVERLCVYHLVPAGRGGRLDDVSPGQRRSALERIFAFAAEHRGVEVLTVDNPSDGPFLLEWLVTHDPHRADVARRALRWNRGATAGAGIALACIDERGEVHPDQFARHHSFGNVRHTPFSRIWRDATDPFLRGLRSGQWIPETCTSCEGLDLCGGGFRSRAELVTGDPAGFDPSCNLVAS